ncbi:hypothetical protein AB4156_28545 [Cupriavidus sp. 2MCAB6]
MNQWSPSGRFPDWLLAHQRRGNVMQYASIMINLSLAGTRTTRIQR